MVLPAAILCNWYLPLELEAERPGKDFSVMQ